MKKAKITIIALICLCTILSILLIITKAKTSKREEIMRSAMKVLYTLDINDENEGYEQFLNSVLVTKYNTFTKEKYLELRKNSESSALFENYFLVKYTTKDYLLIRYQQNKDKIQIIDIKIVPKDFNELFTQ